ncbi:MAG: PEGA domain-containing protein [Bacteroidales bacterium]|nr:PEGA domain-containing protein [Bacteroidales bacterium]MBD5213155.1 PEGA domain-containing protein [Bacteroidales bacterium]
MKKIFSLLLISLYMASASAELEFKPNSWKSYSSNNRLAKTDLGHTNTTHLNIDWPTNEDGDDVCALLIVKFENMSPSDIKEMNVQTSRQSSVVKVDPVAVGSNNNLYELKIFLTASDNVEVTLTNSSLGSVKIPAHNYDVKGVYEATILNPGREDISFTSDPPGAEVTLDGKTKKLTPCTFEKEKMGYHHIAIASPNPAVADSKEEHGIDVSSSQKAFHYDLRKKKNIRIEADPKDAALEVYYNGQMIKSGLGQVSLEDAPYEFKYTIIAKRGRDEVTDYLFVDANTPSEYKVKVLGTKTVSFMAKQNNEEVKGATIVVNGQEIGQTPTFKLLDYGKYVVSASYNGYTGEKKIKVGPNTKDVLIKIPNRKRVGYHPYDIDYNKRSWGLTAAYVHRFYNYSVNGKATKRNWVGEEGGSNGVQIGITYQPYFGYGQGLSTGVFWQGTFGTAKEIAGGEVDCQESAIFVPLQYQFRLPLHKNYSIALNVGAAMTYGLSNKFTYDDKSTLDVGYGHNEEYDTYFPDAFDYSALVGFSIQLRALQIEAKYSIGLKDHKVMHNPDDSGSISYKSSFFSIGASLLL